LKQYTHYRALQVVATTFDCTTYVQWDLLNHMKLR
jgi:hypothetical protein